MTALVSSFLRCYHYKNNDVKIFSDSFAEVILSDLEYNAIASNMSDGIKFFNPEFVGDKNSALKWIVNNRLSPSVLGRSAFCESSLFNAIKFGCKQYLIFASGYDTFAYRNDLDNLKIFEIDKDWMIDDKINRLKNKNVDISNVNYIKCDFTNKDWINNILNSSYNMNEISFCSLLGISYYLSKEEFFNMLKNISNIIKDGSSIVFDYPSYNESASTKSSEILARGAGEEMRSKYTYEELEYELSKNGLLIYEHLNNFEMTNNYFSEYNKCNPYDKIIAPDGVCYILAVKR